MVESLQHKLDRVRSPRVQITYDVEIGSAIVMKELPFVLGIMADLSGNPETPLPKLRERKFVEIDRDNFDQVLQALRPRLTLRVDNMVNPDEEHMSAELFFEQMDDFTPVRVIGQIPALDRLYQIRVRLKDLMIKLDGNDALEDLLKELIENPEKRSALQAELDSFDLSKTASAEASPPPPSEPPPSDAVQ